MHIFHNYTPIQKALLRPTIRAVLIGFLGVASSLVPKFALASDVLIVKLDGTPQVAFAADHLRQMGEHSTGAQWRIARTIKPEGVSRYSIVIALGTVDQVQGNLILRNTLRDRSLAVPGQKESYQRLVKSSNRPTWIVIAGRDANGVMYGALDLANEIDLIRFGVADVTGREDPATSIQAIGPKTRTPSLRLRGVNIFLSTQALDDQNSWFHSIEYWQEYLDTLALDRFNFLDIHAAYHLYATLFPNILPYLIKSKQYPNVKADIRTWPNEVLSDEQTHKNLEMLNTIIRLAADRGIRVGLMNYSTQVTEVPGRGRPSRPLMGKDLEAYTAESVKELLVGAPGLWVFGFRVGEGGQPTDFYRRTYFKGIAESGRKMNLYARTWAVSSYELLALTKEYSEGQFFLEPKYNGEHLGLPYQAILGGPGGSYSYEIYTNYPRSYKLIWQVRANGTHRAFHWGDLEFARRMAQSCLFGEAEGFTLESMECYYPQDDYLHKGPATHSYFHWMFERDWFYYMTFGLAAYDFQIGDAIFIREFQRRIGETAGPLIYAGVTEAARIVPTIYSYHCLGFDQRDMAPEFENGNGMWGDDEWTPGNHWITFGDIDTFIPVKPLDRSSFASIPDYVEEYLTNSPSGRKGPLEVAEYLSKAADTSAKHFDQAAPYVRPRGSDEFACWRMDVEALNHLAHYYQKKLWAATSLQFYYKTHYTPLLCGAILNSEQATGEWRELARVTSEHFGWAFDRLRMRTDHYTWQIDLDRLGSDTFRLQQIVRNLTFGSEPAIKPEICSLPLTRAKPFQPVVIHATGAGTSVRLYYRKLGEETYHSFLMQHEQVGDVVPGWDSRPFPMPTLVTGEIPASAVTPGTIEYFFEATVDGSQALFPTPRGQSPYQIIVSDDDHHPRVIGEVTRPDRSAGAVEIQITLDDPGQVANVTLWYKATPSFKPWAPLKMEGQGGPSARPQQYQAKAPLTAEGLLYYFQITDNSRNAFLYPDPLKRTPYFVVPSWDVTSKANTESQAKRPKRRF